MQLYNEEKQMYEDYETECVACIGDGGWYPDDGSGWHKCTECNGEGWIVCADQCKASSNDAGVSALSLQRTAPFPVSSPSTTCA